MKILSLLFVALLLTSCSSTHKAPGPAVTSAAPAAAPSGAALTLNQAIEKYTHSIKHLDAFQAPYYNVEEDYSKFGDYASPDFYAQEKQIYANALSEVNAIDANALNAQEKITYRLFKEDMEVNLKGFDFPTQYLEFNQMSNRLHDYLDTSSQALTNFPFDSVKHYQDYLGRAQGFPAYVNRQIELLKEGITKGIVLSCTVTGKVPNSYRDAMEANIQKNPFFRPIGFMPDSFSETDRKSLTESYQKMVSEIILPNYKKFDRFYRTNYMKHCRSGFGTADLPDGENWYKYAIKSNTNLDLSPEEIHETGLKEVARISAELEKIKKQEGYTGTLRQFLVAKAEDPKSFFKNSDEIFAAFAKVKAEVAAKVPNYFSLVPKSDFKIVSTSNPEDASGSYNQPTETAPYGRFMINTHNLRAVPIFDVNTLSLHETVPGHHFQLALQYEMKNELSEYQRKIYNSNAFVEGWALYAETLGNEMGMYTDPNQRFGNLNDEMLRAVRLVVDTGIHSLKWSQKKAIAYAREHLASDLKDVEVEINRYSVWPGQALGYKIGQLKILELRHRAEQELGSKFDLKGFHKAVIGNGTVSLGVMESQVNSWIASLK